jgi:hypothetical protein
MIAVIEKVSLESRKAMARTKDKLHVRKTRLEVGVGNVDAWARAPVAKKAWLNIREFEWAIK